MPHLPPPDPAILARRAEICTALKRIIPATNLIEDDATMAAFDTDGLSAYRNAPLIVALPETAQQIAALMRFCQTEKIKIVPRGAGTSLSGGAIPLSDGILIGLGKFNKITDIDIPNRTVTAQSGVTNLAITKAVEDQNFYYAPDPSSQMACSIGGNIAENSGGVHCLKYGLTTNNILGIEMVTIDGDILQIGGKYLDLDNDGFDILGIMTGSEGLLGIVTSVTVRILPTPETRRAMLIGFDSIHAAATAVSTVIRKGIIPAGMEMMDNLAINATEDFIQAGYPRKAKALLIIELDGTKSEVDDLSQKMLNLMKTAGATTTRLSQNEQERAQFWAGRKAAFPAVGRLAPDYLCMDGTIPRKHLAKMLQKISQMSQKYQLQVANVFHAGDGNLHPLILFDANTPGELEQAENFGADILRTCVEFGGVLTGEHGVGIEKRDLMPEMFSDEDLKQQQRLKCAFDPQHLLNPGKVFPTLHRCAELGRLHVHRGQLPHPDLPRF